MQKIKANTTYKAFVNAFAGMGYFFRHERNGRSLLIIGVFIVILGKLLNITQHEWIAVLICIGIVLSAEMMNSALEKLCNYLQPSFDLQIKIIKDVAAAAVLFLSLISAVAGALIFFPKLWQLL